MAVSNPPAYLQAGTYPAALDRLHQISIRFLPTTLSITDVAARSGVLAGPSARQLVGSMTNWDFTVGRGAGVIENTFTTQGGDYTVINTASQTLTHTASAPTTNRIDVVGIRLQDAFYTGVVNSADLAIVQGTPAAGVPSVPALPATFLPLYQVAINAATSTGVVTDIRKRTSLIGAIYQPFSGQVADNGTVVGEAQLLGASGPYPARMRVWDGSAWRGVGPLGFATPGVTANAAIVPSAQHIISSLSVPDPGFSYRLLVAGAADWAMVNSTQPNHPISLSTTIDQTQYDLGVVSRGNAWSINTTGTVPQPTAIAPAEYSSVLTGAHTVRLIARNSSGSQNEQIRPLDALLTTALTVQVVPA